MCSSKWDYVEDFHSIETRQTAAQCTIRIVGCAQKFTGTRSSQLNLPRVIETKLINEKASYTGDHFSNSLAELCRTTSLSACTIMTKFLHWISLVEAWYKVLLCRLKWLNLTRDILVTTTKTYFKTKMYEKFMKVDLMLILLTIADNYD